jgi:hypothetical protein
MLYLFRLEKLLGRSFEGNIVMSTWEDLKWNREIDQQDIFLKIDFNNAHNQIDWFFITKMRTCLRFGPRCVGMVNILFSSASTFYLVNNLMPPYIFLH